MSNAMRKLKKMVSCNKKDKITVEELSQNMNTLDEKVKGTLVSLGRIDTIASDQKIYMNSCIKNKKSIMKDINIFAKDVVAKMEKIDEENDAQALKIGSNFNGLIDYYILLEDQVKELKTDIAELKAQKLENQLVKK